MVQIFHRPLLRAAVIFTFTLLATNAHALRYTLPGVPLSPQSKEECEALFRQHQSVRDQIIEEAEVYRAKGNDIIDRDYKASQPYYKKYREFSDEAHRVLIEGQQVRNECMARLRAKELAKGKVEDVITERLGLGDVRAEYDKYQGQYNTAVDAYNLATGGANPGENYYQTVSANVGNLAEVALNNPLAREMFRQSLAGINDAQLSALAQFEEALRAVGEDFKADQIAQARREEQARREYERQEQEKIEAFNRQLQQEQQYQLETPENNYFDNSQSSRCPSGKIPHPTNEEWCCEYMRCQEKGCDGPGCQNYVDRGDGSCMNPDTVKYIQCF